jgi:hypothetical protein
MTSWLIQPNNVILEVAFSAAGRVAAAGVALNAVGHKYHFNRSRLRRTAPGRLFSQEEVTESDQTIYRSSQSQQRRGSHVGRATSRNSPPSVLSVASCNLGLCREFAVQRGDQRTINPSASSASSCEMIWIALAPGVLTFRLDRTRSDSFKHEMPLKRNQRTFVPQHATRFQIGTSSFT